LDRLCATHFLTLLHPSLGFDSYFGNHWARSTNQPLCYVAATSKYKKRNHNDGHDVSLLNYNIG